ncbi:MAG: hypothetical protein M4579_002258 [Chaenotheca gracillima]|nr:MAG: hypothetical protein M4579_002258 [Chaenotheca gracillima]
MPPAVPQTDYESFSKYLKKSDRILALLGAGLSASSGLPTFRGAGGMWRNHDATGLATPGAFNENPELVWRFYSYRRHMALQAQPNPAHRALAELARRNENFLTLSQNVDGLSQRAGHPSSQLHLLHGSLFDIKCTSFYCDYYEEGNEVDPIVPALAIPTSHTEPAPSTSDTTGVEASTSLRDAMNGPELDISNPTVPLPAIELGDLPHCPKCKKGLLRPAVVWFGEALPKKAMSSIDEWVAAADKIDLILVIGTSSKVYPAAGYVDTARSKGARVAVINMDRSDIPGGSGGMRRRDWFFEGDAGKIVPEILKDVIGDIS